MARREVTLVLTDQLADEDYAELASAVWMLLQTSRHRGYVQHDGKTPASVLDGWWQKAVDQQKWS